MVTATASVGDPDGDSFTLSYQWLRNGSAIIGATSQTLDLASVPVAPADSIAVRVTATDGQASSAPLTSSTVTVADNVAPAAPASLSAALSTTSVTLEWDDNAEPDLGGYLVRREGTLLTPTPIAASRYVDATAPMGISDYEVSAVDTTGNDSVPASVTVTRHIGLRSTSSAAASASTTISIPRPSGAAAGDVLVATITVLGSATVSTPAGWQLVRRDANGTALSQQIYTHLVASGETGPAQWTFSASSTASGVMAAYVGVDPVTPVDVAGGQANSSSTQITAPSVTARVDNGALVVVAGIAANATVQPAAVLLERAEQLAGAGKNRVASELADQSLQSGGATGARTAIASKAGASIGQVLVLRPSSAPAPQPTAPSAPLNPARRARRRASSWLGTRRRRMAARRSRNTACSAMECSSRPSEQPPGATRTPQSCREFRTATSCAP